QKYLGGIRNMKTLPAALFVVDIPKENICIAEARKLGITLISIIDSDCDPDLIDHCIPANDDAIRSIRLITSRIADGAFKGLQEKRALQAEAEAEAEADKEEGQVEASEEEPEDVTAEEGEKVMEVLPTGD
ncbi:MAG: 30S ribosomal protein S2, partial [Dehalococcoidia bacterium]